MKYLPAKRLKFVGKAAYTLGTLWQVLKLRSYPLVMHLDGRRVERDNVFVEISNSRYTGTKFLIAPGAEIDDGLLDYALTLDGDVSVAITTNGDGSVTMTISQQQR